MTRNFAFGMQEEPATTVRAPGRWDEVPTLPRPRTTSKTLVSAAPILVEGPPRTRRSREAAPPTDTALVLALAVLSLALGLACASPLSVLVQALGR